MFDTIRREEIPTSQDAQSNFRGDFATHHSVYPEQKWLVSGRTSLFLRNISCLTQAIYMLRITAHFADDQNARSKHR